MASKRKAVARRRTDPLPALTVEVREVAGAAPGDLVGALAGLLLERAEREVYEQTQRGKQAGKRRC
jgi:hypothetical protein